MFNKKNQQGFTLIELLIVVAIIGIIAAIAIPNLLNAIQRGKQKRTMGDIRTIATAVESYSIDNNAYPSNSGATIVTVASFLEPTYIKKVPTEDGWNTAFQYATDGNLQNYTVESYGKDGADSGPASGQTTAFAHDIVFSTGSFVAYPDGTQE
jgi:general secretion pathway protein G